jgi:hypothetical protein
MVGVSTAKHRSILNGVNEVIEIIDNYDDPYSFRFRQDLIMYLKEELLKND